MKRDPLFFQLFKDLPGCFFQLVDRSEEDAKRYKLEAIEYKISFRNGPARRLRRCCK